MRKPFARFASEDAALAGWFATDESLRALSAELGTYRRAFFVDPFAVSPARKPRVIILVSTLPSDMVGGAQVQAERTAELLSQDHDVVVVTRALRLPPGLEDRGAYRVVRRPAFAWARGTQDVVRRSRQRWRGVRGALDIGLCLWQIGVLARGPQRTRAIIGYQTIFGGLIAGLAGRLFGAVGVVSIRNESEYLSDLESKPAALLSRLAWLLADRVVLQSDGMVRAFLDAAPTGWLSRARLDGKAGVVPNGVAVADQPATGSGLVFLGRLHPIKGLDVLVSALRGIDPSERPTVTVVGDGPLLGWLREQAADLPIDVVGEVDHDEALARLEAASVLVFPATGGDGMPNAVMEAMARGLAVIATPVGAIPTLLTDGENGLLVAPGDADALRAAMLRLLGDEELRARLGERARQAAKRLSWDSVLERLTAEIARAKRAHGWRSPSRAPLPFDVSAGRPAHQGVGS